MSEERKDLHECDCGCGCEHDHDECDCDEEVLMLQDEDGNDIPFHYVATLEHEGKEYVYLQSAEADDEFVIEIFELESVEEDGEAYDRLFPIEDDLYEVLYNKLMDEIKKETEFDVCEDCEKESCEGCESNPCVDCEDDCDDCDHVRK